MLTTLTHFFAAFGATVVVPVMIFIIALCLRVRPKVALASGLYAGVGLTGFSWIITAFTPLVTKIIKQMVHSTGINLPIVDLGWQAGSLAAFGAPVGILIFVLALIFELILFWLGITKVLVPSGLWNNYGDMIWGVLAYYATGKLWIALALPAFLICFSLILSEIQADRWSKYYQIPNACTCCLHNVEMVIPAIILDPLWNCLGLNRIAITPNGLKKRFGVLGEPTFLGAILGVFIGILGNLTDLFTFKAWGQILQFAIQLAAVMTIFPLVTKIFADAFVPLANEIDAHRKAQDAKEGTISNKKQWFLVVDDGVGYGETTTILSGMILIPIMVAIAFLLPGNRTLPVVDLIALPYMCESFVALTNGNIAKVIANGVVWFSVGLYASSWLGSIYTGAVSHFGVALPAGVVMITSFNLMARPINALIFAAFISQSPLWIGICIVAYLLSLVGLRRYRPQIWSYLNKMASKNASSKDHAIQTNK